MLSHLPLPYYFRLKTLPSHLSDSLFISIVGSHVRKTWTELKTEIHLYGTHVRFFHSEMRNEKILVWRLYPDDGFLLLDRDPDEWILSNPAHCLSVLTLELTLGRVEKIDSVSKLHNLQRLLIDCFKLEELPANLGDLGSLAYLSLECRNIKSLPNSIGKLSNLTALHLNYCYSIKELPANVSELSNLSLLNIQSTPIKWLPWSIAKLFKLSLLLLPSHFRLQTLPSHLNDSVVISLRDNVRKTWEELKTEIDLVVSIPVVRAESPQFLSTPGYVSYQGDPRPWIQEKGLYSLVRILDLNFRNYECEKTLSDSIVDIPMLTHLYISQGCLCHLPVIPNNITHLSLFDCIKFECDTEPCFGSLGKLSTLQSLELLECPEFPAHMDLPVSLTHLTLEPYENQPFPDSYVASIRKLSNLKSLALIAYDDVDLSLLNLNIVKLKIWNCSIKSLPAGLRHLEIMHSSDFCEDYYYYYDDDDDVVTFKMRASDYDADLQLCLNNLVNLETLSATCRYIQSFPSIEGLLSLQELHLKDCFTLRKFPPNVDKLVNLRSINVSGTRIKSLPHSIHSLQNLEQLILPKCFAFESLSQNFKKKVVVIKDDTDDFYYEHEEYHHSRHDSSEDSKLTSGSIEDEDEVVSQEPEHEINNEQASLDRLMNPIANDTQVHEGSHFSGRLDQIDNVFSSSLDHEKEILPAENEDCVVPVAPENHSNFHETYGHHIPNNISQQVHADPNGLGGSHFSGRTDQIDNVVAVAPDNHSNFDETYGHHIPNNISQVHADPNALGVSENIPQGVWSSPNQSVVTLPSRAANPNSYPHETTSDESDPQVFWNLLYHQPVMLPSRAANPHETTVDESNEQTCLNRLTDNNNLEMERRNPSFDSTNPVHDRSNEQALVNEQKKTQKIEITKEHIVEQMSQNMRLVDAAEQHLHVSRSTLKRKLKEYNITWETEKKRKHQDAKSKKQNKKTPSGGNFSGLNSVDSANLVGHDHTVEHSDGMNQVSLSDHLPSEGNVVYNTTPDAMRRIVEQPSSQTHCPEDGSHQLVEEHRGVNECTLSYTVQPNGSSSSFVVKATYDGDTVKIQNYSLSFSIEAIEQLMEKVGKKLGLEVGKFKLKYLDEDNEWILVRDISDLEDALGLSRSSGSNVVKLTVELIRQCNN